MIHQEKDGSYLSQDVEFNGKAVFKKHLVVDGSFKGEIKTEGELKVGENASLEADVKTGRLILEGKVKGKFEVDGLCELKHSADISADINAKNMKMEEGAKLEGKISVKS